MTSTTRYYGKYRATVVSNLDPLRIGRLMLQVPDVGGSMPSSWAMPCFPVAGQQMGMWSLPPIGAGVWVEFEQGDPDYPIWSGCWFGSAAEVPSMALAATPPIASFVLQTPSQNVIQLSDLPGPAGGILLKTATGALISVSDVGITISNGKGASITLTGPTVSVNNGALSVV